jgi:hypothetical protein
LTGGRAVVMTETNKDGPTPTLSDGIGAALTKGSSDRYSVWDDQTLDQNFIPTQPYNTQLDSLSQLYIAPTQEELVREDQLPAEDILRLRINERTVAIHTATKFPHELCNLIMDYIEILLRPQEVVVQLKDELRYLKQKGDQDIFGEVVGDVFAIQDKIVGFEVGMRNPAKPDKPWYRCSGVDMYLAVTLYRDGRKLAYGTMKDFQYKEGGEPINYLVPKESFQDYKDRLFWEEMRADQNKVRWSFAELQKTQLPGQGPTFAWDGIEIREVPPDDVRGKGVYVNGMTIKQCTAYAVVGWPTRNKDGTHTWEYLELLKGMGLCTGDVRDCPAGEECMHGACIAMMCNEPQAGTKERVNCIFWQNCLLVTRDILDGEQLLVEYDQNQRPGTSTRGWTKGSQDQLEPDWGNENNKPPGQPRKTAVAKYVQETIKRFLSPFAALQLHLVQTKSSWKPPKIPADVEAVYQFLEMLYGAKCGVAQTNALSVRTLDDYRIVLGMRLRSTAGGEYTTREEPTQNPVEPPSWALPKLRGLDIADATKEVTEGGLRMYWHGMTCSITSRNPTSDWDRWAEFALACSTHYIGYIESESRWFQPLTATAPKSKSCLYLELISHIVMAGTGYGYNQSVWRRRYAFWNAIWVHITTMLRKLMQRVFATTKGSCLGPQEATRRYYSSCEDGTD